MVFAGRLMGQMRTSHPDESLLSELLLDDLLLSTIFWEALPTCSV